MMYNFVNFISIWCKKKIKRNLYLQEKLKLNYFHIGTYSCTETDNVLWYDYINPN